MVEEPDSMELKDCAYFNHTHWSKPTFRSGDLVTCLKWRLTGMIKGHTYGYLGEECCDVEMIWGEVLEEMPVTALRIYTEEEAFEFIPRNDYGRTEEDAWCLSPESGDRSLSQPVGISDICATAWID